VEKTKKLPPGTLLEIPELDPHIEYLWGYFLEVYSGAELTFQEVAAWSSLTGKTLNPDEVKTLRLLAVEILDEKNKNSRND